MTAALVLLGFVAYFVAGPLFVAWCLRRVDAAFQRDMARVLRDRIPGGSERAGDDQRLSALAGVERDVAHCAAAPPAPQTLAGAARPRDAAPTRLHHVHLGGDL